MEKNEKDTKRKKGKIMQMKAFKVLKKKLDDDAGKPVLAYDEPDIDTECLALFQPGNYEDLFGSAKKDMPQCKQRLSVVKISSLNRVIYRQFAGRAILDLKDDCIGLSPNAWQLLQLDLRKCPCAEVKVEKGCKFMFYWRHSNSATRISFKLGLISIALAVVGIILTVSFQLFCQYYQSM